MTEPIDLTDLKERIACVPNVFDPEERDFLLALVNTATTRVDRRNSDYDIARERYEALDGCSPGVWIAMLQFWRVLDKRGAR